MKISQVPVVSRRSEQSPQSDFSSFPVIRQDADSTVGLQPERTGRRNHHTLPVIHRQIYHVFTHITEQYRTIVPNLPPLHRMPLLIAENRKISIPCTFRSRFSQFDTDILSFEIFIRDIQFLHVPEQRRNISPVYIPVRYRPFRMIGISITVNLWKAEFSP